MGSELPEGWRVATLGEVGQILKARGGTKKDDAPEGTPVIRYGEIYSRHDTKVRKFYSFVSPEAAGVYTPLRRGDILFAGSGETLAEIGKATLFDGPEPALGGGDILIVRPAAGVMPLFLVYAVSTPDATTQKMRIGQGSSVFHLYSDGLETLRVWLPPLAEQKKIAQILSSVDEAIHATQAVIDQTRRVKEAMLQTLLTRGLGHTRFQQTEIGEIPEGWEVRRLDEIARVERGKFSHRPRNAPHLYDGPYPFVQTGDVGAADDQLISHSQTINDAGLAYSRLFPAGTILMTIAANIGSVAVTTYPVACPDSLVGITPNQVDTMWLLYALAARQKMLDQSATVSAQKNINLQTLEPMLMAVPPLPEQRQIQEIVRSLADALTSTKRALLALESTKSALLQTLLSGQTRVTP